MSTNNFLRQLSTGDTVKDFAHASRTFVDSGMRLHPKVGFLYHVFFDINPNIKSLVNRSAVADIELGLMARNVSLPKFSVDVKSYNAYNRNNLVQGKIKYDPVTITFHDDMANVVSKFWYQYYSYYYSDTRYAEAEYALAHKYVERQRIDWGLRNAEPFIRNIRIYQLHKKQFTEFVLVNPMITSWQHGEQDYGASDPVQSTMSVQFETVKYRSGIISPETVKGFAEIHYDKTPSPLTPAGGGTNSILGPGGILATADSILGDLASGNLLGAVFKTARGVTNFKDANLKGMIKEEGGILLKGAAAGAATSVVKSIIFNPKAFANR
jgi:hypothetical protein